MNKRTFDVWKCVNDHNEFKKGQLYAAVGRNNGIQIAYSNKEGDTKAETFWNYGDYLGDETGNIIFIPQDENIPHLVLDIVEDVCSNYCKYPETWDEEKEGMELCESEVCGNCPLNKLV